MTANLQTLQQPTAQRDQSPVTMGFANLQSFELMQRAANLLSNSTLVPVAYRAVIEKTDRYGNITDSRKNPNALANSVVALNMAQRMGADPLMVMQNLYIVEGRPSWSSQWIIAAINGCGRFAPLRFDIKVLGEKEVECITYEWGEDGRGKRQRQEVTSKVKVIDKQCIAWTVEKGVDIPRFAPEEMRKRSLLELCREYGVPVIESPLVSIEMAVKEGWYTKNGSKWKTMDEVMLRYRSSSFFGKLYAPELLMGLQTVEEVQDFIEAEPDGRGGYAVNLDNLRRTEEHPAEDSQAAPAGVNTDTGEVIDVEPETGAQQAQAEQQDPVPATGQQQAEQQPNETDELDMG